MTKRVQEPGESALVEWSRRVEACGYEAVRERYLGGVVQEFFDYDRERYEVTTEATWDGDRGGDLRVLIEVSRASAPPPRRIFEGDLILIRPQ
jgi:hypothetical protein